MLARSCGGEIRADRVAEVGVLIRDQLAVMKRISEKGAIAFFAG